MTGNNYSLFSLCRFQGFLLISEDINHFDHRGHRLRVTALFIEHDAELATGVKMRYVYPVQAMVEHAKR